MSRIIKSSPVLSPGEACGPIIRTPVEMLRQFQDAEDDVQRMLEHAEREAMTIVSTARSEVQSVIDEAYQAGYHSGLIKATEQVSPLVAKLETDIANVEQERGEFVCSYLEELEPQLLKLCLEAVEKIIKHEIKTDPQVVVRMIKSCLRRIKDRSSIEVRMSPEQVAYVREQRDELISAIEGTREISVTDDRRISPGGCVIESASGTLDATIETQLNQIAQKIMETYQNARSEAASGSAEISRSYK